MKDYMLYKIIDNIYSLTAHVKDLKQMTKNKTEIRMWQKIEPSVCGGRKRHVYFIKV